ncbi:MAG: CtsR family transcriptional regulator [Oscillospiraceae bacterium]|nr:CtsR family transcriptional regulator [Oscillospiraceae bacterium]
MRISDEIAAYILHMLERGGTAELQRNLLAEELGCVPSQINYVITSRFTPEQGYVVESRRGGGGYIRIRRVEYRAGLTPLMHTVNAIGPALPEAAAAAIIQNLAARQYITADNARVMLAAVGNPACREVPAALRDSHRAAVLKVMLTGLGS